MNKNLNHSGWFTQPHFHKRTISEQKHNGNQASFFSRAVTESGAGFTLIELLMVVAIIALISSMLFASVNVALNKARAAQIANDFSQMERAFLLLMDREANVSWWLEAEKGGPIPTTIAQTLEDTELIDFLQQAPVPPNGEYYRYENDGPGTGGTFVEPSGCPTQSFTGVYGDGVNLMLVNLTDGFYFTELDRLVDNSDGPECGRLHRTPGTPYHLIYLLDENQTF